MPIMNSVRQMMRFVMFAVMVDITFSAKECAEGWTHFTFTGTCYKMFSTAKTWLEAVNACYDESAVIVDIANEKENEFIAGLCLTEQCWTAGEIITKVRWQWYNGRINRYSNWNSVSGSPDYKTKDSCVYIYGTAATLKHRGTWNATDDCNSKQYYVCVKYPE